MPLKFCGFLLCSIIMVIDKGYKLAKLRTDKTVNVYLSYFNKRSRFLPKSLMSYSTGCCSFCMTSNNGYGISLEIFLLSQSSPSQEIIQTPVRRLLTFDIYICSSLFNKYSLEILLFIYCIYIYLIFILFLFSIVIDNSIYFLIRDIIRLCIF